MNPDTICPNPVCEKEMKLVLSRPLNFFDWNDFRVEYIFECTCGYMKRIVVKEFPVEEDLEW